MACCHMVAHGQHQRLVHVPTMLGIMSVAIDSQLLHHCSAFSIEYWQQYRRAEQSRPTHCATAHTATSLVAASCGLRATQGCSESDAL